ncbi:1,4-dihydroxy-2-naphthoyl-CoA synthase [Candidatus Entotheonellaceae bacterium PAL068K]
MAATQTPTFTTYLIPTAVDIPQIQVIVLEFGEASGPSTPWYRRTLAHPGRSGQRRRRRAFDRLGIQRLQHLWELPKPVIGAINGWTLGVASGYGITTHITVASESAVFAQPKGRHISNTNFVWTLPAGFKNALLYGLTGDPIDAHEAHRIGLVNKVVPPE